jgi:hypothetical protein
MSCEIFAIEDLCVFIKLHRVPNIIQNITSVSSQTIQTLGKAITQ